MSPKTKTAEPPTMSGPDHGVPLSIGQLTATCDGAGIPPVDARMSETSSGRVTESRNCCVSR